MYRELVNRWPFGRKRTIWDEINLDTTLTLIGGVGLGMTDGDADASADDPFASFSEWSSEADKEGYAEL